MLKLAKERNKFSKSLNEIIKLSVSVERLLFFALMFAILSHVTACMWYFIAKIEGFTPDTWVVKFGFRDSANYEIYMASLYFVQSTITTVGYGDIVPGTTTERWFALLIMIVGVITYSFAVGSLSTLISSLDSREAILKEKMNVLQNIRKEYDISTDLYMKLRKVLKYDHKKNQLDRLTFLDELPHNLKVKLSYEMHYNVISKFPFFKNKPEEFIAHIGALLKPVHIAEGEYIYKEGEPISDIYFLTEGQVAFVLSEFDDSPFITIDKGKSPIRYIYIYIYRISFWGT